jgi:hypothetical protein
MQGASLQCMQATEMLFSPGTPSFRVTPGHLVLGLAGGDTTVALDATLAVADEFHTCHCGISCRTGRLLAGKRRRTGFAGLLAMPP